ncbi:MULTISPECIES: hypothetical protein [Anoxybacillus]|uniref:Cell division protein FtsB n=1 Tax=Anoxybacillus tengchongensis TaxID=576944 RepID=A0A7W9YN48_9BACL|nr:hypothetical protein [Anoxybacillus tengchongensis]MBB6175253.1 cell division protein FtsB [Anoxybacillus tengchongensis]
MVLIDWLLNNLFVVFVLVTFVSWIGKRMKTVEETIEQKQQQEQQPTVVVKEIEPETRREVKKEREIIVPQQMIEQQAKVKQLPTHPLVQGVIFSEVFGPPRAKRPYSRK